MLAGRLLIAEDDPDLLRVLVRTFDEEGYDVCGVTRGADLLDAATGPPPAALLVDIGLPDTDGRDVCQALRARGVLAPVLFLTARDSLPDRLSGFAAGGDDYVTKPFALEEVVVRIRALIRRGGGGAAPAPATGLRLDPGSHAASCDGRVAALTPTEFRLLALILARAGDVIRRRELVSAAWPAGAIVHDNTLDVYVARLRRKLAGLGTGDRIETVHGVGYRLR